MAKKESHFTRHPLEIIPDYVLNKDMDFLNKRWDDEDEFQREAIRFIYSVVETYELIEVCAIPGGSARLPLHLASKLKLNGVRAGVCDLMLLWAYRGIAFIELKAGGSLAKAQKEFLAFLEATGHKGCVCRTLKEVYDFLKSTGVRTRIL